MKNNTQPALKERIEKALEDFTKGRASMHVPPLDTDVDVVLAECSDRLSELKARCAALAAENAMLKQRTQQLIDIISNTDNDYCMCGSAMKDHVHSGCGYPTGMFDYYYNQWLESDNKTPATDAFLAEVRAQGVKSLSNAVQSVIAERQRHQSAEGWTPEHDDQYSKSQLLWASSCYVLNAIHPFNRIPFDWPWTPEWWKPTNPRRDLVKAGALILAEIERIDRQEAVQ
ncbi:hypothetical protein [Escherichia coli]|uniref:hypothetical protein n=1 Tax=Escherichia coli TaxID=562 RepID=UPI0021B3A230|nr:hypothetical protein [Escherichia coli]